jgi:hypothetical protein
MSVLQGIEAARYELQKHDVQIRRLEVVLVHDHARALRSEVDALHLMVDKQTLFPDGRSRRRVDARYIGTIEDVDIFEEFP